MNVVYFLVPLALMLAGFFVIAFVIGVKSGQFDDLETPAYRLLLEDEVVSKLERRLEDVSE